MFLGVLEVLVDIIFDITVQMAQNEINKMTSDGATAPWTIIHKVFSAHIPKFDYLTIAEYQGNGTIDQLHIHLLNGSTLTWDVPEWVKKFTLGDTSQNLNRDSLQHRLDTL